MRSGTLPTVVSLAPTWHLPLRLLVDDVASRHARATGVAVRETGSVVLELLAEMSRLLDEAMDAPALMSDFFAIHKHEAKGDGATWVQRRLPAFAASAHASVVRQVIAMLHLLHRKLPLIPPVGAATSHDGAGAHHDNIRDAVVELLVSLSNLGPYAAAAGPSGSAATLLASLSKMNVDCASLQDLWAEEVSSNEPTDPWAAIVALHALLCSAATGDAEFIQFNVAASSKMQHVAEEHGDALWAASQPALARISPSKRQRLVDVLRSYADVKKVSLCAAAAAGDVELIRTRLEACDSLTDPGQLFTAAELCINGGLWPEVRLLFEGAFAQVALSPTPNDWLSFLSASLSPAAPQRLDISGVVTHVASIGNGFCRSSAQLHLVTSHDYFTSNVAGPEVGVGNACVASSRLVLIVGEASIRITKVGDSFLRDCTGLTAVDLMPLANVTSLGHSFLRGCTGLREVNLTPVDHVTSIDAFFLSECTGLTTLGLATLAYVTKIGHSFLRGCKGLTTVDLTPLAHLTSIDAWFLDGCAGLATLDLTPLSHVTSIDSSFLDGCTGLRTVDLTPLEQLTSIGCFLGDCTGLTAVDLKPLTRLTSIGNMFLFGCTRLTTVDLTPFARVTSISSFLRDCIGLTAVDLTPLAQLTSIGPLFLDGCIGLTAVDLTPLAHVTSIGDRFLCRCTGLNRIDLTPLTNVTLLGHSFLGDSKLTALDLTPLAHLTGVGDSFLHGCTGLRTVDLSLEHVTDHQLASPLSDLSQQESSPTFSLPRRRFHIE